MLQSNLVAAPAAAQVVTLQLNDVRDGQLVFVPFSDPGSLPLACLHQHLLLARVQVVLLLFLVVGSVLVGLFLGYHLLLARSNMTSYESYKWRDYKQHCLEAAVLDRWVSSNVGTWHILDGCTALPGDSALENSCAATLCQLPQLLVMCHQMPGSRVCHLGTHLHDTQHALPGVDLLPMQLRPAAQRRPLPARPVVFSSRLGSASGTPCLQL